jgi:hypothetical protein
MHEVVPPQLVMRFPVRMVGLDEVRFGPHGSEEHQFEQIGSPTLARGHGLVEAFGQVVHPPQRFLAIARIQLHEERRHTQPPDIVAAESHGGKS